MIDWQRHARSLVAELSRKGVLAPGWREAFEQVPRHVFVPTFYTAGDGWIADNDATWLAAVYSDEPLVTQVMAAPEAALMWPTSSSTRPSLMASMLGLLDVSEGHQVLEIGTGTGYNAGLLCHRLGDTSVTSIDIDPSLAATAQDRLAKLGYHPHVAAGNGAEGVPGAAPFDRIMATCGVPIIPPGWIRQLADEGLIVADVRGELASSLVVAHKTGPHTVSGRFLRTAGRFMWLREELYSPLRNAGASGALQGVTDPIVVDSTTIPCVAFDDADFRFLLQLAVPQLGPIGSTARDGTEGVLIVGEDGRSWVEIRPDPGGRSAVHSGGHRPLWPMITDAWRRWNDWGRPTPHRFGMTAHDDGRRQIWLDHDNAVVLTDGVLRASAAGP